MMEENKKKMRDEYDNQKMKLSVLSTITFVIFTLMHVTLSYEQYDITRMCAFNNAVSLSSLP